MSATPVRRLLARAGAAAVLLACSNGTQPAPQLHVVASAGSLSDTVGHTLAAPYQVLVTDLATHQAAAGITVSWRVSSGGGSLSVATSITDSAGHAGARRTLGSVTGVQLAQASVAQGDAPAVFVTTALPGALTALVKVSGDSQRNAASSLLPRPFVARTADRYGNGVPGVSVHWSVAAGAGSVSTVNGVTDAGGLAATSLKLDSVSGPETVYLTAAGLTDSLAFHATAIPAPLLVATIPIPPNYGIHDTFIRDGIAFVCAWNSGVYVYDVGNGIKGGTPAAPVLISNVVTATDGVSGGTQDHNSWWFWNPVRQEKKYLFVGQEGPAVGGIGAGSSGDIHVVDVSTLSSPVEVATFHIANAGTHNFWMDEAHQILYAAYYNGGVVSIDVSGTLSGDISSRLISEVRPGGSGNTYTWGVQLANGSLYASDMLSGFWQLSTDTLGHLAVVGGGDNVPQYFSSDLGVAGGYAYTGTWDWSRRTSKPTSVVSTWQLGPSGAPTLVDTIQIGVVSAISDVKVSPSGKLLMFSTEGGANSGFYFSSLANPAAPVFLADYLVNSGIHTAKFATINGHLYAFGAQDPPGPALIILDVTSLDQ